eukprot:504748_1
MLLTSSSTFIIDNSGNSFEIFSSLKSFKHLMCFINNDIKNVPQAGNKHNNDIENIGMDKSEYEKTETNITIIQKIRGKIGKNVFITITQTININDKQNTMVVKLRYVMRPCIVSN